MSSLNLNTTEFQRISKAIELLHSHSPKNMDLSTLSTKLKLSPGYLQKEFSRWAGISPKRYSQFLQKEYALSALKMTDSVLEASLESYISSPGRLHDLMVTTEAMTPGEIRQQGKGLSIRYGVTSTPFGEALIATTARGICHLAFIINESSIAITKLREEWPAADFTQDTESLQEISNQIFNPLTQPDPISVLIKGSNFQIKVWQALLTIPSGHLCSYSQLAQIAMKPKAQRALGTALATNQIAYLIPCHRVIRANADIGQYRWGVRRKRAMQFWEAVRTV